MRTESAKHRNILRPGDTIAVVSLSDGRLNQQFQIRKLQENASSLGLNVFFPENAQKSYDELRSLDGAKMRAQDLKTVFANKEIKAIFAAIGGTDTYRTLPYLLDDQEFITSVQESSVIFSGYSDTTTNHLMFYKLGLPTFYGPNGLSDLAELNGGILPYTRRWLSFFFSDEAFRQIQQSEFWYEERSSFTKDQVYVPRIAHKEDDPFDAIQGCGIIKGNLLGGCIETLTDMCSPHKNPDSYDICRQYAVFPTPEEWANKIVFIESSAPVFEQKQLFQMLEILDEAGIFIKASAVLVGKPQNKKLDSVFRDCIRSFFKQTHLNAVPIMGNVPFGHGFPKCILPYAKEAILNLDAKAIAVKL